MLTWAGNPRAEGGSGSRSLRAVLIAAPHLPTPAAVPETGSGEGKGWEGWRPRQPPGDDLPAGLGSFLLPCSLHSRERPLFFSPGTEMGSLPLGVTRSLETLCQASVDCPWPQPAPLEVRPPLPTQPCPAHTHPASPCLWPGSMLSPPLLPCRTADPRNGWQRPHLDHLIVFLWHWCVS